MGKETKEMLKKIISNQELIMKHLQISKKEDNSTEKKPAAKSTAKKQVKKK
jgi:hypothetical protein